MYSFVVPVYNVEIEFLRKCLESLDKQKEVHEIVVVDDGSSENKAHLYDQLSNDFETVRIFHTPNRGVSCARNFALSQVSGEWVIFVDSDDWVEDELLSNIEKNITPDADIIIFDAFINGMIEDINRFWHESPKTFKGEEKHYLLMQAISKRSLPYENPKYNTVGVVWGKCYRTDFLREHGLLFKEGITVNEDTLFNLYAMQAAKGINYFSTPLYHYRKNGASVMASFKKNDWDNNKRVIYELTEFMKQNNGFESNDLRRAYEYNIVDVAIYLLKCYVFNKNSGFDSSQKELIFKMIINEEPYSNALSNVNMQSINFKDKTLVYMAKKKSFNGVKLYVFVLDALKAIRNIFRAPKSYISNLK